MCILHWCKTVHIRVIPKLFVSHTDSNRCVSITRIGPEKASLFEWNNMMNLLPVSSPFLVSALCILLFHWSTLTIYGQVISASFVVLTVYNYIRNIGSALHHPMKLARSCTFALTRLHHQHLGGRTWEEREEETDSSRHRMAVIAPSLCPTSQETTRRKLALFSNIINFSATKSEQKCKMSNLRCKWVKVMGAFLFQVEPFVVSSDCTLCFLNPARDLLHISMGNSALNNSTG